MPSDNRAATRTLVRWNDDLDKSVLLYMVYACGEAGIKLPYKRMAELMGPRFTEGAIVQHISKVRIKMEQEQKTNPELLVPGPVKRGSITKPASVMGYSGNNKRKVNEVSETAQVPRTNSSSRYKSRKMKRESDEDGDEDDEDGEWSFENKKAKKPKKSAIKKHLDVTESTSSFGKAKAGEDQSSSGSATASPRLMNTRGVKQDYREIAGDYRSEYDESGPDDDENESLGGTFFQATSPEASLQTFAPSVNAIQHTQAPGTASNSGAAFMPRLDNTFGGFNAFGHASILQSPFENPTPIQPPVANNTAGLDLNFDLPPLEAHEWMDMPDINQFHVDDFVSFDDYFPAA